MADHPLQGDPVTEPHFFGSSCENEKKLKVVWEAGRAAPKHPRRLSLLLPTSGHL